MDEGQFDQEALRLSRAIEVHHLEPGHLYLIVVDKHQVDPEICRPLLAILKERGIRGILITANGLPAIQRIEL